MSEQKPVETLVEKDVLLQAQSIWQKNQKQILIGVAAIVVIVGGWFAYQNLIAKPNEEKAADAIYPVQKYFAQQDSASLRLTLNGDGVTKGALYIIKNYSGTKAANLAHYYAGLSYLKLGEFQKAIDQLKDFSTDAKQVQMAAYGALGDAYSELKKNEEAISYYEKAGKTFAEDEFSSAEYLFRAASLNKVIGKNKEALELYKTIKEKFPKTDKGNMADKYIYQLSIEKNDFSVN